MRRDDKFRFSLQWGSDTEEKAAVGSLLERMGNKKSDFIVMAVAEYMERHPEVTLPGVKIKITYQPRQSKEQMLETVKEMTKAAIEEFLAGKVILPEGNANPQEAAAKPSDQDLDAMLAGLDFFKQ